MELIRNENEVTGAAAEVIAEILRADWTAGKFLQEVLEVMFASGTKELTLDSANVGKEVENTPIKVVFLGDKVTVEILK